MKQQFLKGKTGTIRLTAYEDNIALVPSSALITLLKPDGSTLQAQASATVGSDGEMTYALTATHTADHDLNYKAQWEYVVSGTTYYQDQLWDCVKSVLAIPIIDEDLTNELDALREVNDQIEGTATSATSSTLVDTSELKQGDDYWNGGTVEIISGTGVEQMRDISDFVQSTSTITVTPDWVTDPDSTSVYVIIRSFTKRINQSFEKLTDMIYNKGRRHELILESSQIKYPLIFLTIMNIALDSRKEEGDKWDLIYIEYKDMFEKSFDQMRLEYDADESGTISDEENQFGVSSFRITRS